MKNREIISEIRNSLRSATTDEFIPSKFIYFKLKGVAALFIKREADDKRLFRYSELFTTIKCLEMEEEDLITCCNISIPNCTKVMKSKKKLPEIYSTRFGYLINVSSVDYGKNYIPITPEQYKYTKSREFIDKSLRYFWIQNGHLIIPDSMTKVVTAKVMSPNKAEALKLDNCSEESPCIRLMDQEFVAPEHLLQDIKNATILDFLKSYKQLQPDELTDQNVFNKTNPPKQ